MTRFKEHPTQLLIFNHEGTPHWSFCVGPRGFEYITVGAFTDSAPLDGQRRVSVGIDDRLLDIEFTWPSGHKKLIEDTEWVVKSPSHDSPQHFPLDFFAARDRLQAIIHQTLCKRLVPPINIGCSGLPFYPYSPREEPANGLIACGSLRLTTGVPEEKLVQPPVQEEPPKDKEPVQPTGQPTGQQCYISGVVTLQPTGVVSGWVPELGAVPPPSIEAYRKYPGTFQSGHAIPPPPPRSIEIELPNPSALGVRVGRTEDEISRLAERLEDVEKSDAPGCVAAQLLAELLKWCVGYHRELPPEIKRILGE